MTSATDPVQKGKEFLEGNYARTEAARGSKILLSLKRRQSCAGMPSRCGYPGAEGVGISIQFFYATRFSKP